MSLTETGFELLVFAIGLNIAIQWVGALNLTPGVTCYVSLDTSQYQLSNLNNSIQETGITSAPSNVLNQLGVYVSGALSHFSGMWNMLKGTLDIGTIINGPCFLMGSLGHYGNLMIDAIFFITYTMAIYFIIRGISG